eukprot:7833787-Alexandrium_andersonii.AAC.1
MSASLVGSEMCIRDSRVAPPPPKAKPTTPLPKLLPANPKLRAKKASRPVSYTHLTLPTICSV